MGQSNTGRFSYIDKLNREARSFAETRSRCIVDGCNGKPIRSHLIPRAWLSLIARNGHVVDVNRTLPANSPTTREARFYENLFENVSRPVGIDLATVNPVFCSSHNGDIRGVGLLDNWESDLASATDQHILFYKAICFSLYETERVVDLFSRIAELRPRDVIKRHIYFQRQQTIAHRNLLSMFHQCLERACDKTCSVGSQLEFKRLFVKGDGVPTVSAIGCGSGLVNCESLFGCASIGCDFPRADFMVACKPAQTGHIVIIARTRRDRLGIGYCSHASVAYGAPSILSKVFNEPPQGVKLELFVSKQLIESSQGFLCSPARWGIFGSRMKNVVQHHFVEQPSRFHSERKARFPTEINRTFNLFRSIK